MHPFFTFALGVMVTAFTIAGLKEPNATFRLPQIAITVGIIFGLYFLTHNGLDYIKAAFNRDTKISSQRARRLQFMANELKSHAFMHLFSVYRECNVDEDEPFDRWLRRHIVFPPRAAGLIGKASDHPFVPNGWKGSIEEALYRAQAWFTHKEKDYFLIRMDKRQYNGDIFVLIIGACTDVGQTPLIFATTLLPKRSNGEMTQDHLDKLVYEPFEVDSQGGKNLLKQHMT